MTSSCMKIVSKGMQSALSAVLLVVGVAGAVVASAQDPSSQRIQDLAAEQARASNGSQPKTTAERVELYSADTKSYLGCLNCSVDSIDSLRNPRSLYSQRLKNEASRYRDRTGELSMCARLAESAPYAEFIFGPNSSARYQARASLNRTLSGSICSYDLRASLGEYCRALEDVCKTF
jgi:hypothetical protein